MTLVLVIYFGTHTT